MTGRVPPGLARGLVALALVGLVLAAFVSVAAAQGDDVSVDTDFDGGEIGAGITGRRPGRGGGGGGGGSGAAASPYYSRVTRLPGPCPVDPSAPGVQVIYYLIETIDRRSGAVVRQQAGCIPESQPAPPPPPPAPSYAELRATAPIPRPQFEIAPGRTGLTGLATELRSVGSVADQAVAVSLRGWTADVHARAVSIRWTITGPSPGTYAGPIARHTFERVGVHTITLSITWAADADVAGYGLGRDVDLGTRTSSITRTYPVRELRSQIG